MQDSMHWGQILKEFKNNGAKAQGRRGSKGKHYMFLNVEPLRLYAVAPLRHYFYCQFVNLPPWQAFC